MRKIRKKIKSKDTTKGLPSKRRAIAAVFLLAAGILLMPSGFLLSNYIQQRIDEGIKEQVEVPSKHSSAYDEWLSNDYDDAPEIIRTFYLWNLTNPNEYLAGAKPIYEEIGPFIFREYDYKYDVKFNDDNDEVTFKKYTNYVQLSGDKVSEVNITNINPGYLGAREQAGGTDMDFIKLIFPMTLTTVRETFIDEYETSFDHKVSSMLFIPDITNTNYMENNITDVVGSVDDINQSDNSYLEFASNKTSLSVDLVFHFNSSEILHPFNFLLECSSNVTSIENLNCRIYNFKTQTYNNFVVKHDIGIDDMKYSYPTATGPAYLNSTNSVYVNQTNGENTVKLRIDCTNTTYNSDFKLKIDALNFTLIKPGHDALTAAIYELGYPFPTGDEVFMEEWANDYYPYPDRSLVPPALNNTTFINLIVGTGATTVDSEGSALGIGVDIDGRSPYNFPGSYADLNITRYYKGIFALPWGPYNNITYEKCLKLWDKDNPNSLTGFDYLGGNKIWYDAVDNDTESKNFLMTEFDINSTQLDKILKWINVSIHEWSKNVGMWTINDWNAGFIVTRTAEEWLFTANDTAIWEHQVYYNQDLRLADVGLFDDIESKSEAEQIPVDSFTINTGRSDVSEVGQTLEFNGQDTIYIWAKPEDLEGTDGLEFAPGVSKDDTLKTFQPDLMRVVELEYQKDTEIYDINLLRFKLADNTFSVNPDYYMYTNGLINLAPVEKYHDVPVRISKPHLLGTDISILRAVDGMKPNGDYHDTYIDVEPLTGIVMNARNRIQVNFEVEPTKIYQPNINHAVMPIAWYEQRGEITEELAEEFKDQLYSALDLKQNVPLYSLSLGAMLCIPGAIFTTKNIIKRRHITKRDKIRKRYVGTKKDKLILDDKKPESS